MAKSERPPIYMVRKGIGLFPEMEIDAELMDAIPFNTQIKVTMNTTRSPSKLRWYWGFLGRIVKATECAPSAETLHDIIKLHTGYVVPVMVKGFPVAVPKSISFATMSEEEFESFRMNAIRWIAETYQITPADVFPEDEKVTTQVASPNIKWAYADGELIHLRDFARKALDDATSNNDAPAKDALIERMRLDYMDVISSDDGIMAINSILKSVAAVINGKRSKEQAALYIATEFMDGADIGRMA